MVAIGGGATPGRRRRERRSRARSPARQATPQPTMPAAGAAAHPAVNTASRILCVRPTSSRSIRRRTHPAPTAEPTALSTPDGCG
jgi:hypothetical protein